MKSLDNFNLGDEMIVKEIVRESKIRRKLLDMGVIPGIGIKVVGKAPLGDPISIEVRGYNLTLRKDEAKAILV